MPVTPADRAEFRRPRSRHTGLIPASDAKREAMALAEMVDIALHRLGGIDYLVKQGRKNPSLFFALLGKRLPRVIEGVGGGPVQVSISAVERVIIDPRVIDGAGMASALSEAA